MKTVGPGAKIGNLLVFTPLMFTNGAPGKYYVYAFSDLDGTVVYIGKGFGNRIDQHHRTNSASSNRHLCHKIIQVKKLGVKLRSDKLLDGLSEKEASRLEVVLIALLGREDCGTGRLYNFTDGGEGSPGVLRTEKTRTKLRAAAATFAVWFARSERFKKMNADPVFKAAGIERTKKMHADPVFSAAIAARNSEKMKEKNKDPVFKANRIAALKKKVTDPEYKAANFARASEYMKNRNADPEYQARAAAGKKQATLRRAAEKVV
jgi:hypothetical protein